MFTVDFFPILWNDHEICYYNPGFAWQTVEK